MRSVEMSDRNDSRTNGLQGVSSSEKRREVDRILTQLSTVNGTNIEKSRLVRARRGNLLGQSAVIRIDSDFNV